MRHLVFLARRTTLLCFTFLIFAISTQPVIGALKKVSSPGELQSALDSANPGDTIQLAPAEFIGEFVASKDGPITVTGDVNSTIVSEGNAAFTIKGNNWKLKSFKITKPSVGVLIEGTGNSLEGLIFQTLGKGIQVRAPGNTIKSCVFSDAEGGIYVEADDNQLYYNSINIQTPSIYIAEGTANGLLNGNVANGRVDLKGDKYEMKNNVFNHGMYVTGCDNTFAGNVVNNAEFPKNCASHDLGGNSYRGLGPNDTDPPQPGQQQQQQQQQYNNNNNHNIPSNNGNGFNNGNGQNQGGFNKPGLNQNGGAQRQTFPAQVTGGAGSGSRQPQCTCTCV